MSGMGQWEWPTYEQRRPGQSRRRGLDRAVDFSDTDMSKLLRRTGSRLVGKLHLRHEAGPGEPTTGIKPLVGNFELPEGTAQSGGIANNGVISVELSTAQPVAGSSVVQDQTWIPEALALATSSVHLASFDKTLTAGPKRRAQRDRSLQPALYTNQRRGWSQHWNLPPDRRHDRIARRSARACRPTIPASARRCTSSVITSWAWTTAPRRATMT